MVASAAAALVTAACFLLGFLAGYRVDLAGATEQRASPMEARCAMPEPPPPPPAVDQVLALAAHRVARSYSRPGLRTVVVRLSLSLQATS